MKVIVNNPARHRSKRIGKSKMLFICGNIFSFISAIVAVIGVIRTILKAQSLSGSNLEFGNDLDWSRLLHSMLHNAQCQNILMMTIIIWLISIIISIICYAKSN